MKNPFIISSVIKVVLFEVDHMTRQIYVSNPLLLDRFALGKKKNWLIVSVGDIGQHNIIIQKIPSLPLNRQKQRENTSTVRNVLQCMSYLSSFKDTKNMLYDVVQNKPTINAGVSVKALRSLWEQTNNIPQNTPPVLYSKSGRKLAISTSVDRNSLSQVTKSAASLVTIFLVTMANSRL